MRFTIHRGRYWRYLLVPFGGVESRSFIDVSPQGDEKSVRAVFGLFDETIPLGEIASVGRTTWSFPRGIGWRVDPFTGTMGLIGSYDNVVEIVFHRPQRLTVLPFIHMNCSRLCVSIDDPDAVMELLASKGVATGVQPQSMTPVAASGAQ